MFRFYTLVKIFILVLSLFSFSYTQNFFNGKVVDSKTGAAIENAVVKVKFSTRYIITDRNGEFNFTNLPDGKASFTVEGLNIKTIDINDVQLNNNDLFEIKVEHKEVLFEDVMIYGAHKRKEKITESPASIAAIYEKDIEVISRKGQIARAFAGTVGIDVLQSGSSDFIVNARGFNNGLNRRILVLQDGRDVAMPLLGAEEWNSFPLPLDEFTRAEFIRGPGAALYGSNAFNGVLNLVSYSPREVLGTKISFLGGDYKYFRGDLRHAGAFGNFSYKITLGHQENLNYAARRDSIRFLEYPGLAIEKKILTQDDRNTFATYGTLRIDYDIDQERRIIAEGGYSRNGDETFVFGLGRTFVPDVDRPFMRLAYNSPDINIQAHYMQRNAIDTMWLLVPAAPLLDNSKDMALDFQHNITGIKNLNIVWGLNGQLQYIRTYGTSIPNDVDGKYLGIYAQGEYETSSFLKIIASGRVDFSNIFETQFSPRFSIVYTPMQDQQFRLSFCSSFQRPNYSELYRMTPDAPALTLINDNPIGPPVNMANLESKIADSIKILSGRRPNLALNLDSRRAFAVGNANLEVEKNMGLEFGYKGVFGTRFFITVDAYYNRLNDFITNFLPGVNNSLPAWNPQLPDSLSQYASLVKSMVYKALAPRDRARLSMLDGKPAFVVSNANVGKVDQYGIEAGINYYINDELLIGINYSHYDFDVISSETSQPLLPNTSPDKINLSISYNKLKSYDCSLTFQYSEGFDWLAGAYYGRVPAYAVMSLSAGYYIMESLQLAVDVFNVLDRKHYQIFGGTYLPRTANAKLIYKF